MNAGQITAQMIDDAIREIGKQSADKALRSAFASKLRTHAPELVEHLIKADDAKLATLPFPPKDQITALEAAIFDNLKPYGGTRPKKGKRGHSVERYKAVLKVWTCPPKDLNFQSGRGFQRFEVLLQTSEKVIETAKKHEKSRPELADALRQLALSPQFDGLGGALSSKPYGGGTVYHGRQMLMANDDMRQPSAAFFDMDAMEAFTLPPFSAKDSSGRPLGGNVILHSRYSPFDDFSNWRTGANLY